MLPRLVESVEEVFEILALEVLYSPAIKPLIQFHIPPCYCWIDVRPLPRLMIQDHDKLRAVD